MSPGPGLGVAGFCFLDFATALKRKRRPPVCVLCLYIANASQHANGVCHHHVCIVSLRHEALSALACAIVSWCLACLVMRLACAFVFILLRAWVAALLVLQLCVSTMRNHVVASHVIHIEFLSVCFSLLSIKKEAALRARSH